MADTTTTPEENTLQEEVTSASSTASNRHPLTSLHSHVVSMVNRAAATFVVAITRAVFQMIAAHIADIVNRNKTEYYYTIDYYNMILTNYITFLSGSNIIEEIKSRMTTPYIIYR